MVNPFALASAFDLSFMNLSWSMGLLFDSNDDDRKRLKDTNKYTSLKQITVIYGIRLVDVVYLLDNPPDPNHTKIKYETTT